MSANNIATLYKHPTPLSMWPIEAFQMIISISLTGSISSPQPAFTSHMNMMQPVLRSHIHAFFIVDMSLEKDLHNCHIHFTHVQHIMALFTTSQQTMRNYSKNHNFTNKNNYKLNTNLPFSSTTTNKKKNKYLFAQPLRQRQDQFLSGIQLVWIQSFPSPRLVAIPRQRIQSTLLLLHNWIQVISFLFNNNGLPTFKGFWTKKTF